MKFDKDEIKEQLTTAMVEDLVRDFGGDPQETPFGFIAGTICHNHPGEGSHKLYYYENTRLFRCYTGCDATFDIFELVCKVHNLANPGSEWSLYNGVRYVANKFGISGEYIDTEDDFGGLPDMGVFDKYARLKLTQDDQKRIQLKEYDESILNKLCYPRIGDWIDEGMDPNILRMMWIGFCPSTDQITIPHYDDENRFIGLRGRTLGKEEAELYGKYRPMILNGQMYNHPLGLNLYNLTFSKENIKKFQKAIIFEGEKSCLLYKSYFGWDQDISVACCGSSVTSWQINKLIECGAKEIIIAFDRQYQKLGDAEYEHWIRNLHTINLKYSGFVNISFILDTKNKLGYKDSPIDKGPDVFKELYKNRVNV